MNRLPPVSLDPVLGNSKVPFITFIFLVLALFIIQRHDLFISLLSESHFQPSAEFSATKTVQGDIVRRVVLLALGLFGIVTLFSQPKDVFKINNLLGWLILIFITWALLSIIWAEDIQLILRRTAAWGMFGLGILAASKRFSLKDIIWFALLSTSLYLVIGLISEIALSTFHPLIPSYRFTGTLHPNQQGLNCALLSLSSFAIGRASKRGRKLFFAWALIGLLFLVLTKTRTSFAFALLALSVYWWLISSSSRKLAISLSIGFMFCLLLLLAGDVIFKVALPSILLGRYDPQNTATLTDRIPLWKECLDYVAKEPLLGYGFNSFWTPEHILKVAGAQTLEYPGEQGWGASGACSSYIDLLLGVGIIGMVVYVMILIVGITRSFKNYKLSRDSTYAYLVALLIFCMLCGLLESGFVESGLVTFLYWIALVKIGFQKPFITLSC